MLEFLYAMMVLLTAALCFKALQTLLHEYAAKSNLDENRFDPWFWVRAVAVMTVCGAVTLWQVCMGVLMLAICLLEWL